MIGITGGIATGKSACAAQLRQLLPAATFFDADHAARELAETDPEARTEIAAAFGPEIYSR
ncbi:MAG: dephospho-CoA kinase, partial [Chthoniobacterales bacterium]